MQLSSWGQGASSERVLFRQGSCWELPGVFRMEKEEGWVATCLAHWFLISDSPLQHPGGDILSLPDERNCYRQPLRSCGKCSWPGNTGNLMPAGRLCQNLCSLSWKQRIRTAGSKQTGGSWVCGRGCWMEKVYFPPFENCSVSFENPVLVVVKCQAWSFAKGTGAHGWIQSCLPWGGHLKQDIENCGLAKSAWWACCHWGLADRTKSSLQGHLLFKDAAPNRGRFVLIVKAGSGASCLASFELSTFMRKRGTCLLPYLVCWPMFKTVCPPYV